MYIADTVRTIKAEAFVIASWLAALQRSVVQAQVPTAPPQLAAADVMPQVLDGATPALREVYKFPYICIYM